VTGWVDEESRALLRVPVSATLGGPRTEVEAWIDTAFTGGLTMPRSLASGLGLPVGSSTDAVLADGSQITLIGYDCFLDWFGGTYRTEVVATDGAYPLLGTQLLAGRRLEIDYAKGTVELI
jgi:predicted aspartyl protease